MNTETLICKHCNKEKPIKSFSSAKRKNGERYYWNTCCACHSAKWRAKNKEYFSKWQREYKKSRIDPNENIRRRKKRLERKIILLNYINQHSCKRCGENDIRTLCFHHKNPSEKSFGVTAGNRPLELLKKEVLKCDVLCSNCHLKTHEEMY